MGHLKSFPERLRNFTLTYAIFPLYHKILRRPWFPSTEVSSTAAAPLNPFNVTPDLKQAVFLQKLETASFTAPPPLNPYFLTPPPTVETPSQGPKRKSRRSQFVNYLNDSDDAHGKQETGSP